MMKRIVAGTMVTAGVAIYFAVSAYSADRSQLLEARKLARLDLLAHLDKIDKFEFSAPTSGLPMGTECFRTTYLTYYESQVCYIEFSAHAKHGETKLIVKYYEPRSRLSQAIYQSNDVYLSFVSESGELVADISGDGVVVRTGSGSTD